MKKIISILLALAISLSLVATTSAAEENSVSLAQSIAQDLKELNLFKGVSDTDFDLNRAPTRVEALVMLIRVLGKESVALNGSYSHPFTDVPAWADKYVGYAYSNGLTKGVSATKFGSGTADSAMYFTFVLRALGYSDTNGKDFTWNNPYDFATSVGIRPVAVDIKNFMRSDVAMISYCALEATLKDSSTTLAGKLISDGVFSFEKFHAIYDPLKSTSSDANYSYNCILRDFIVANGESETISAAGIVTQFYTFKLYSTDNNYSFELCYNPETGVIYASEAYTGGGEIDRYTATFFFAGNGSSFTFPKVTTSVNDNGTRILASSFISPKSYTSITPTEFDTWFPIQIASDYYTKEKCSELTSMMILDIIETCELIFSESKIGFSMTDLGYTSFFK